MSAGSEVPAASKGSWTSFLTSISSFSGDLSSLTAPPFILSGTSLVEYSSYWVSEPSLLIDPAKEKDPEKRAVMVMKWFISTLKPQYSSRSENLGSEKKPLNPFLGETFRGKWDAGADGELRLVSEQVSHHPPVTAYCIWNEKNGVELQGYNGQKASISRGLALNVRQVGHAILRFKNLSESYCITLPPLHLEGLITGAPYVELDRSTYIVSTSGYTAKLSYTGKGWVSGKKNSFTAVLYHTKDPKKTLYTAEGQWTGAFSIKDHNKAEIDSYDPSAAKTHPLIVAKIEDQEPLESRRAWQKVAEAIKKGDMDVTQKEKSVIENEQRDLRKKEKEGGKEWTRKYFKRVDKDAVFDELAKSVGETAEPDKTDGVWTWNGQK